MARTTRAAGLQNPLQKVFPRPVVATRAPTSNDTKYDLGQVWINKSAGTSYTLTTVSSGSATWALSSPGASDVDGLDGDSGTSPVVPTGGIITLTGGTNISTVGGTNEITFNLDAAISLATSVTSPLYTASAAPVAITAPAGQDVNVKLGDAAGATEFNILDSADSVIFSVDSNGVITFTNLSNTGTFTTAGGTASINASSNFNTVINSGTSTGSVTIGNAAAGAVTLDSSADITLTSVEDSADAIYLHANGGTSETIRLHADQGTGAASVHLESDAGGITLTSTGLASSDAINLAAVAGGIDMDAALDIVLTSTEDAADAIYLHANGGTSETIRIHSDQGTGAASVHLESDVGGITLTSTGLASADAINLSAAAGGVDIDGALQVNIASSQNAADAVRINASAGGIDIDAAGAAGEDITLDNAAGSIGLTAGEAAADALSLQAASGGLDIDTGLAIIADAAGNVEINSSAGQILIGNDDVDQNASFATDGERTVTVGSTNGAAGLVLQAGTGEITMTGTVKEINAEFLFSSGTDLTVTQSPLLQSNANTGVAPTGSNGDVNLMYLQDGCLMEQFIIGTQTIIAPRMDANGLDISLDQTISEGAEYNFGARNNAKHAYTIGTSAAFFITASFYVEDLSGCLPLMVGFRKVEANNAVLADYTDYAAIGLNSTTSATNVVILSELNGGGQTATDTTDAWGGDMSVQTVSVLVSAAGVTTFEVGGSAASSAPAYTFDNGDVVMPFIHFLQGADLSGVVGLQSLKIGFQA